jgi:hypothetical protein
MGRPPINDTAMTATELQRRWRAKKRRRALLAGRHARTPRKGSKTSAAEKDLWSTPPCLAAALAEFVLPALPRGPVWEPAAGLGALVDALRAAGREVVATDIDPLRRDIARLDYLKDPPPASIRGAVMATNPPFSRLDAFLARTLALLDVGFLAGAALLIRNDFGGTDGRVDIFNRAVAEFECCWRSRWIPGSTGNPMWWCQWVVFEAGRDGPPVHRRLRLSALASLEP